MLVLFIFVSSSSSLFLSASSAVYGQFVLVNKYILYIGAKRLRETESKDDIRRIKLFNGHQESDAKLCLTNDKRYHE